MIHRISYCFLFSIFIFGEAYSLQINIEDSLSAQINAQVGDSAKIFYALGFASKEKDLIKSIALTEYALSLAKQKSHITATVHALHQLALANSRIDNYQTALAHLYEALELEESTDQEGMRARLLLSIGIIYDKIGDYDNALDNYHEALAIYRQQNNFLKVASLYNNIGLVYYFKDSLVTSMKNFRKAVAIKKTLGEPEFRYNYGNYGLVYLRLGDYDSAHYFFSRALQVTPFKSDSAEIYGFLGQQYYQQKDFSESIEKLKISLTLASQLGMKDLIKDNARLLSESFASLGEYRDAYQYAQLQNLYTDSLHYENNQKKIAQSEGKYLRMKLERQIEKKNLIIYFSTGTFALIVISIISIILIGTKRKNAKQLLKERNAELQGQERERKRISEDLHDGLGGALAGVKLSLLSLEEQDPLINLITQNLDRISNDVRTIAHNLTPADFYKFTLTQLIENYIFQLKNHSPITITYELYPEKELNQLSVNIKTAVYRIIQELLTNVYKHAHASEIDIQLTQHSKHINLIVEDNGRGFLNTKNHSGLGLRNVKSRVEILKGSLDIDSAPHRGTIINIDLKT